MELDENTLLFFMNNNGDVAWYNPDENIGEMAGVNVGIRGIKGIPYDVGLKGFSFIR